MNTKSGVFKGSLEEFGEFVKELVKEQEKNKEDSSKSTPEKEKEENWEDIPQNVKDELVETIEKTALCIFKDATEDQLDYFNKNKSRPGIAIFSILEKDRRFKYYEAMCTKRAMEFMAIYKEFRGQH